MADFNLQLSPEMAEVFGIPTVTGYNLGPPVTAPTKVDWQSVFAQNARDAGTMLTTNVGGGLNDAVDGIANYTSGAINNVASKSIVPLALAGIAALGILVLLKPSR